MKVLIITVGNRQIGWRCKDGQIHCIGSKSSYEHIYRDLGLELPSDGDQNRVRDLGDKLNQACQASGDFDSVQLLLDQIVIEQLVEWKLEAIWLVATDQPETVGASFRAGDTVGLAQLMMGKIQQTWSHLQVRLCLLQQNVSDTEKLRDYYGELLLQLASQTKNPKEKHRLWLQTKGSTPHVSAGLEICAAALSRDLNVHRIIPQETREIASATTAEFAQTFQQPQSLSQYFWPIEKPKTVAAWEKGNFGAVEVWLQSHSGTLGVLKNLAQYLERATHQDLAKVFPDLKEWIVSKPLKKMVEPDLREEWLRATVLGEQVPLSALIWESSFQIPIYSHTERWADAIFLTAQTLERLLVDLESTDHWRSQSWVILPEQYQGKKYDTPFSQLIKVWKKHYDPDVNGEALEQLREWRNKIAHEAKVPDIETVKAIWNQAGWPIADPDQMLLEPLKPIAAHLNLPDRPLLTQLYDWGLEQLRAP